MKSYAVSLKNGGVCNLMSFIPPSEALDKWSESERALLVIPYEIDEVLIGDWPQDRTFRNAWGQGADKKPMVDMPKARAIQMDRIREKRNKKLAELDLSYMAADEANDAPGKAAIAKQKKALRDLPATYDLSGHTSPDTLKDDWPTEVE